MIPLLPLAYAGLAALALSGLAAADRRSATAALGTVLVLAPLVVAAALICAGGPHA